MKAILILIATGILLAMFCFLSAENKRAFEMCMEAGVQDEDTCRFYTAD